MSTDAAAFERRSKGISLVIPAGIVTTILTLFANWWLAWRDFDIMGIYFWFIIPAGAIGVGMLAASGYVFAAWLRGEKVRAVLLISVFGLQSLAYVQAQYTDYKYVDPRFENGEPMGFGTYFDMATRNITFKTKHDKGPGKPLGAWGYGVRTLEFLGFTCGALLALGILASKDYCETCERYMRGRAVITLPASVPEKSFRRSDVAGAQEYQAALSSAQNKCDDMLASIITWADKNDPQSFRQFLQQWGPSSREAGKLPTRVQVTLAHCPECAAGHLTATLSSGHGKSIQNTVLWKHPVSGPFVTDYLTNLKS